MKPITFQAWQGVDRPMRVELNNTGGIGILDPYRENGVWLSWRQAHLLIEAIEKAVKAAQRSEE